MHAKKLYLTGIVLWAIAHTVIHADTNGVVTRYNIRPQGLNNARKVAGTVPGENFEHLWRDCGWYSNLSLTPEYTKTFRPSAIAQALFGRCVIPVVTADGCTRQCDEVNIIIQGTAVPNRLCNALRADDFYLPDTFSSIVSLSPKITTALIDLNWYVGFDGLVPGLYVRVQAPFVHTKWNIESRERVRAGASGTMIAGSFAGDIIPNNFLLTSATSYFAGSQPKPFSFTANPNEPITLVREPLLYTQIVGENCSNRYYCDTRIHPGLTKNGVADIRLECGWDFLQTDEYHLGLNVQTAIPTGNTPSAQYLFSPYVGNGKHWELGGGITAHWHCWRSEDTDQLFGLFVDATITHLFANTQERVFDLKGRPLSRYALAALHTTSVTNNLSGQDNPDFVGGQPINPTPALYQFDNQLSPIANLTQQKVRVSFAVQGDVAAWCTYKAGALSWDIGYNFYGQSAEKLEKQKNCQPRLATENLWTIKGDAHVYGFTPLNASFNPNQPYALAVSESTATIIKPAQNNDENSSVDNPQYAYVTTQLPNTLSMLVANQNMNFDPAFTTRLSSPPRFLTVDDIDYQQRSRITTHKIFTHITYAWDCIAWEPYLGIGAEVEFGTTAKKQRCYCSPSCGNACAGVQSIGTSLWGAWFKVGMCFE